MRSCQHMTPANGYAKAKQLLQKHFGNEYKIATAYMEKAVAWPPVRSVDLSALLSFSAFML